VLPSQTPGSRTGWLAFPLTVRESAPFSRRELQTLPGEAEHPDARRLRREHHAPSRGFRKIARRTASSGYPSPDRVMKGGVLMGMSSRIDNRSSRPRACSFEAFARDYR